MSTHPFTLKYSKNTTNWTKTDIKQGIKCLFCLLFFIILLFLLFIPLLGDGSNLDLTEPGLLLAASLISLLIFSKLKTTVLIIPSHVWILFIYLLFLALNLFKYYVDYFVFARLIGYGIFFAMSYCLSKHFKSEFENGLIFTIIVSISSYLVISSYSLISENNFSTSLFRPNTSIFGILLASLILILIIFSISFITKKKRFGFLTIALIILDVLSLALLVLTNSRSAWLAFISGLLYIVLSRLKKYIFRKFVFIIGIIMISALFTVLLFYKPNSTTGRVHIYKVSLGILEKEPVLGIGGGKFKAYFNEAQANYFSKSNIDGKEALLADNTFYAFNDFLQFIIEYGVVGCILALLILYLIFKNVLIRNTYFSKSLLLQYGFVSVICFLVGSFFSYPLQVFPLASFFMICIAIIYSQTNINVESKKASRYFYVILKWVIVFFSFFLMYDSLIELKYKSTSLQAFQASTMGYRIKSLEKYQEIDDMFLKDGQVLFLYSKQLYYSSKLNKALQVLEKAKKYYSCYEMYKLESSLENELRLFSEAENSLKKAIYMVPNRMKNRFDLMKYYLERGDSISFKFWAKSILTMPVKTSSPQVDYMLTETIRLLKDK
ncbi:MAG: O-antigen ligase family protein [Ferruginibacter sp.]